MLQHVSQLQGDVCVLSGVFVHVVWIEVAHVFLVLSLLPYKLLDVYRLIAEQCLSHVVHVVAQLRVPNIVSEHGVEHLALNVDAIVAQHLVVVFDVLANLQDVGVLIERLEDVYHLLRLFPRGRYCHVESLVLFHGKAQAHKLGVYGIG